MELTEAQQKRRQGFLDWDVEHRLPAAVGDYRLRRVDRQDGRIYTAFAYVSDSTGWEVKAIFDEETMDYMVKTDFRLFVMTDIELITGDFDAFRAAVEALLEKNMRRELIDRKISVVVAGHAFTKWDWQEALPETIGAYRRMVDPSRPLLGLNGSYILAVYECAEKERGIVFFYNMFRDEYYAEMSADKIPVIIHQYDAKTVDQLDKLIRRRLAGDLAELLTLAPES